MAVARLLDRIMAQLIIWELTQASIKGIHSMQKLALLGNPYSLHNITATYL